MAELTQDEAIDRVQAIEVESYDVFLDLTAEPALSRTEVRFRWRRPDASTFAELRTQGVRGATLDGVSLPPPQDGRLALSRPAGGGEQAVLVVEAEAGYSPEGRGLSRFTDPADGATYVMATSYPDCGPEVFCCFDQPDLTATFLFSVCVPDGWECVANGQLAGRAGNVCTFTPVRGMRPYDLTFCAGPFAAAERTEAGPTAVTIRHRRSLLGQAAVASLPRFAGYARDAIAWYAGHLGVPCPYPAYDIVFVPDLAATALSVPGLMVVNERLLGQGDAGEQHRAMVCAHEVAHLWFGGLVGPRWWDDVWLDEAIATYLSYAALAAIAGVTESLSWTEFAYTSKLEAYAADGLPSRQAVSSPVSTAGQGRDKPFGILYVKGASVIRSLGALIGDDALRRGLGEYLSRFTFGSATLDDLVGCWSRASGQDLAGWAEQWLRAEGTPTISLDGAGAVTQDVPRRQRIGIGLYDLDGDGRLRRRSLVPAELEAERTVVAGLTAADAVVLNDQDLSHTQAGFDPGSLRVLTAAACQVGDPLTEAVCWNGFWLLVTSGELPAAQFTDMACRRLQAGGLPGAGIETLLGRAVEAAGAWAPPDQRSGLREQVADATQAATRAAAGDARRLAIGFAASAQADDQLATLGAWLAGKDLPAGVTVDAELRARILFTLAARGLASLADIDALPRLDPVTGAVNRATCLAMRPDPAAKEAAWATALSSGEAARIAQAGAAGLWVPGQEELMAGYRDRYFAEALPALATRKPWPKARLSRLLFPVTLVSEATVEAAKAAEPPDKVLRLAVADQATIMRRRLAARRPR